MAFAKSKANIFWITSLSFLISIIAVKSSIGSTFGSGLYGFKINNLKSDGQNSVKNYLVGSNDGSSKDPNQQAENLTKYIWSRVDRDIELRKMPASELGGKKLLTTHKFSCSREAIEMVIRSFKSKLDSYIKISPCKKSSKTDVTPSALVKWKIKKKPYYIKILCESIDAKVKCDNEIKVQ